MLRRIFGPKREEVTREWRKLLKEELNGLNSSPSIIRVINPRRKIRSEHVAGIGERLGLCRVLWGNVRERKHLEDPGVDGRIIVNLIFRMWDVGYGLDRCGSGEGQVAGTCECRKEHPGSVKCMEFLDRLRTC